MAEWFSYVGAACIIASTLPQAVILYRTRDAGTITWGLASLTSLGAFFLMLRSWEVGDWGFVVVNAWATGFWAVVVALKLWRLRSPPPSTRVEVEVRDPSLTAPRQGRSGP